MSMLRALHLLKNPAAQELAILTGQFLTMLEDRIELLKFLERQQRGNLSKLAV
jgi:hypothetical protein